MRKNNVLPIGLIVVILLSTFFLRFFLQIYQGRLHFANDEARDILIVKEHVLAHQPILLGPLNALSTTIHHDIYSGPFYYYLITPSLLIGNFNPLAPIYFMIILSMITVYLMYYAGKIFISPRAGIISALLCATSEVLIYYSWAWNPNRMPLFVVLYTIFLYLFIKHKTWFYWILVWLLVGFLTQLDLVAIVFIPATIIVLIKFRTKTISFKYVLLAVGIFLLSYFPYIYYELTNHFANIHGFIQLFSSGTHSQSISIFQNFWDKLVYIFKFYNRIFFGGFEIAYPATIILGLAILIYKIKNWNKFLPFLFLTLDAVIIICYSLFNFGMHDHYLLILVPIALLSIVDFTVHLFSLAKPYKIISIAILLLIITSNLIAFRNDYKAFDSILTDISGPQTTFLNISQAADYIIQDAGNDKFDIKLNQASDGNYNYVFDYLFDKNNIILNPDATITYQIIDPPQFTDYNINGKILSEKTIGKVKIIKYERKI